MNITAEKLREEQYNNEVRMLHTAVKTNVIAKAHFDLTEDKLLDYIRHSPNALNLNLGCDYEHFYNQLLEMILSLEERNLVAEKLELDRLLHLCVQENSNFSLEYKRHCEDLSPIMVECTVNLFNSKNGHTECFICFYDITNKFINYTIADKANASKSMFMAGISHDMRTPLNGILSFTDFALKTDSQSQQKYYLAKYPCQPTKDSFPSISIGSRICLPIFLLIS